MRRFYFEDEEGEEDDENMENMEFIMPGPQEFVSMAQENPEHFLLNYAFKICEKSIVWRFLRFSSRIKMIEEAYRSVKKLLTEGTEDADV